ncbi:MAG: DUF2752 domain-containing protein [Eubacteriales bacterium]|nr:DUF2752 domain-containing protein [Eubacteriales bacterium]
MRERLRAEWKSMLLVAAALLAYRFVMLRLYHATCPSVIVSGLPCPGCGLTRAVLLLLRGEWAASAAMNPMAVPVLLFAGYCLIWHFVKGTRIPGFGVIVTALSLAAIAVFCYRMALYFPDRTPCVYTGGSMLEKILPGYRDWWMAVGEAVRGR